jgi:hypothetical protein
MAEDGSEGGGWTIWLLSLNHLYDKFRKDPAAFRGMVFREITDTGEVRFLKVTSCVHRFVPNPKQRNYPDLKYVSVRFDVIKNILDATEEAEGHEQILDKLNAEEKDTSTGS